MTLKPYYSRGGIEIYHGVEMARQKQGDLGL